ncbi:MAG: AAA family ATPase [Ruminococcaceae bacterium]|nr:AAA family ATPase [Oscillospiraceae bacterium]
MPTTWKRSPEELHKIYIANTEAFYLVAGRSMTVQLDEFMAQCALGLWSKASGITQLHVDTFNQLYSKSRKPKDKLLWELTSDVCLSHELLPPFFLWGLAEKDKRSGTDVSRVFVRMVTNILLHLAAVDDEVSLAEAEFITDCTDRLTAVCNSAGVRESRSAINALDYVTSGEPPFIQRYGASASSEKGNDAANEENKEEKAAVDEAAEEEKPSFEELMAELEGLVGLKTVKRDVKSLLNLVKVHELRKAAELPTAPMSLHMVFLGNPGTGKTTVARMLGKLYAAIGVLRTGQLIEVDRSGLVAGFVGQTALKTQEVIKSALGGVLFIDEAYSLSLGGENDFGREAIETLLKAMEDNRHDLVVIVAGYDEPMENFINSNPGLQSRFGRKIYFPDYNGEQLKAMFDIMCKKNGYVLDENAEKEAKELFCRLYDERGDNFGNGRDVRNIFERMIITHSNRMAGIENPSKEELMTFISSDFLEEPDDAEEDTKTTEDNKPKGESE